MGAPQHPQKQQLDPELELDEASWLRSLFLACDVNGSGRLERDDFASLCSELRLRPGEAEAIFLKLDDDRDGAVTFQEFVRAFRGATKRRRSRRTRQPSEEMEEEELELDGALDALAGAAATPTPARPSQAWREFQLRLGQEAGYIPR